MSTLPIAERLKLASKGTREQRAQLIRDSNRMVATAVLTSPKLTESEVEAFAKMGNVSEDVLRIIGDEPGLAQELRHHPRRDAEPQDAASHLDAAHAPPHREGHQDAHDRSQRARSVAACGAADAHEGAKIGARL